MTSRCPKCDSRLIRVDTTRPYGYKANVYPGHPFCMEHLKNALKRKRSCYECKNKWWTIEITRSEYNELTGEK